MHALTHAVVFTITTSKISTFNHYSDQVFNDLQNKLLFPITHKILYRIMLHELIFLKPILFTI